MKKNNKIIIILSVAILIIVLIAVAVIINIKTANNKSYDNQQEIDFKNRTVSDTKLSNNLEIVFESIEEIDESYLLTMIAKNNTDESIDLTNYRVSFQDSNSNELEWFRGTIIGLVNANEEIIFTVEINKSINNISKIVYGEYNYLD